VPDNDENTEQHIGRDIGAMYRDMSAPNEITESSFVDDLCVFHETTTM